MRCGVSIVVWCLVLAFGVSSCTGSSSGSTPENGSSSSTSLATEPEEPSEQSIQHCLTAMQGVGDAIEKGDTDSAHAAQETCRQAMRALDEDVGATELLTPANVISSLIADRNSEVAAAILRTNDGPLPAAEAARLDDDYAEFRSTVTRLIGQTEPFDGKPRP